MTEDDAECSNETTAIIDYGHPPRRFSRMHRLIPRPSRRTIVMLLATALAMYWFGKDYHPWTLQQTFKNGLSPLSDSVSPDGKRIVVLARDHDTSFVPFSRLQMRVISSGQLLFTFGQPDDVTRALHFSPDGSRLVGAANHGHIVGGNAVATAGKLSLHLWNAMTGQLIGDLDPVGSIRVEMNTPEFLRHVWFSPDSRRIVTVDDQRAVLYDATTGKRIVSLEECAYAAPNDYAFVGDNVVFSPDSQHLMVTTADPKAPLHIRSAVDGHVVSEYVPLNSSLWARHAAFSPDGSIVAYTSGEHLNWIAVNDGRPAAQSVSIPQCEKLWFSPNGKEVHILCAPDAITLEHRVVDFDSSRVLPTSQPVLRGLSPYILRQVPATHAFAVFSAGGESGIVDEATQKLITNLHCEPGDSRNPFSPDGREMVNIPYPPDAIQLLSTATWRVTNQIAGPLGAAYDGPISDASFIGDSDHLLVFKAPEGSIWLYERHRYEAWWGVIELISFWSVGFALILLVVSIQRDRRI